MAYQQVISGKSIYSDTPSDSSTVYSDVVHTGERTSAHLHVTSSGTVDGVFTLQSRGLPMPPAGTWADDDDGYWVDEVFDPAFDPADGSADKQSGAIHLAHVAAPLFRVKMVLTVGGTLNVNVTVK